MFLYYIFAIFLGIFAGIFTGLLPGIHINLVALLLLSSSQLLLNYFSPLILVVFIVAMTITHNFLDFIPGIFLGAPNTETALSVLPGHEMLMKGKGYGACRLAALGCFIGAMLLLLLTPVFIVILPGIYEYARDFMALILITASLFLFLNEKKKFYAFFIFMLSGVLGIAVLNLPLKQPLFPLLTGLFGTSMLVKSVSDRVVIPKQDFEKLKIGRKELEKIIPSGIIASSLCSFLPGLGASQAAVIGSETSGKLSQKGFLVLLGMISVLVSGLNFVAIYAIQKPRSGVAVAASQIINDLSLNQLYLLIISAVIAGSLAFIISDYSARIFAKNISRINYSKLSVFLLALLSFMSIAFSGWLGLIILITSTSIGLIASYWNVRKMHLMGCLMIPVILYFI